MIHEAYMPVYMGSRFLARDGRDGTGRTEVVQEALADLKMPIFCVKSVEIYTSQKNLHGRRPRVRDKYQVCDKHTLKSTVKMSNVRSIKM